MRAAYVDVIGPSVTEVLRQIGGPSVVLPAFLASGYHVRTDLPDQVRRSGAEVIVTAPLGPSAEVAEAMHERLSECGGSAENAC